MRRGEGTRAEDESALEVVGGEEGEDFLHGICDGLDGCGGVLFSVSLRM